MNRLCMILSLMTLCFNKVLCQEPAIAMTTSLTLGSTFSFDLATNVDNTPIQIDFGNGVPISVIVGTNITTISNALVGSHEIKVYGEGIIYLVCSFRELTNLDVNHAIDLAYLDCGVNGLTSLDVTNNPKLDFLSLWGNQLSSLDVTHNTALKTLSLTNNFLTELDISKNVLLSLLHSGNNQLTHLDVTHNTALVILNCNWQPIDELDLSQNAALTELSCNFCQLTTLDISKNLLLHDFNCGNNHLNALDVSKNTALEYLYCGSNQLNILDLSMNTKLKDIWCEDNHITELDVSNMPSLWRLVCNSNQISELDLTHCKALSSLNCNYNQIAELNLTHCTELSEISCNSNMLYTLDVSMNDQLTWITCYDNYLSFATLPIQDTSWFRYNYAPQKPISILKVLSNRAKIDLSDQYIINGNITNYKWKRQNNTELEQGIDYVNDNGQTLFLKPQIDSVFCEMTNSTFPDFTGSYVLKTTNIQVMGQEIQAITFETAKFIGSTISFSLQANVDNTPIEVDFGDGYPVKDTIGTSETSINDTIIGSQTLNIYGSGITYFNCDDMQLISIDMINDTVLQSLSCKYNQLTTLDLTKNPVLSIIDCSHNQLINFNISTDTTLKKVSCAFNNLSFATLPREQAFWTGYIYAPQLPLFIVKNISPGIELDLSNQLIVGENFTNYDWKTQNGTSLVEGIDYTINNGKTVFLQAQEDSIYCEFTNVAFPAFLGSDVLKTTNIKVNLFTADENILSDGLSIYSYNKTICINLPYQAQLSVFDINGRLVINSFISSGTNNIQLENTGVYLVKLTGNAGSIIRKVYIE